MSDIHDPHRVDAVSQTHELPDQSQKEVDAAIRGLNLGALQSVRSVAGNAMDEGHGFAGDQRESMAVLQSQRSEMQPDIALQSERQDYEPNVALQSQLAMTNSNAASEAYHVYDRANRDIVTGAVGSAAVGGLAVGGVVGTTALITGQNLGNAALLGGLGLVQGIGTGAAVGAGLYGLGKLRQNFAGLSHEEHSIPRTMTLDALMLPFSGVRYLAQRFTGGRK